MESRFLMENYVTRYARSQYSISKKGCALCVLSYYLSFLLGKMYVPAYLNEIMNENNCYSGLKVHWLRVAELFQLKYDVQLYDEDNRMELKEIECPCIVSVDASSLIEGYQSHFVFAKSFIKNKRDMTIFDPFDEAIKSLMGCYGENNLKGSIYTYVKYFKS